MCQNAPPSNLRASFRGVYAHQPDRETGTDDLFSDPAFLSVPEPFRIGAHAIWNALEKCGDGSLSDDQIHNSGGGLTVFEMATVCDAMIQAGLIVRTENGKLSDIADDAINDSVFDKYYKIARRWCK